MAEASDSPEIEPVARGTHLFVGCASAMVAGFLVWAHFGALDVVSQATGEVVPSSQIKSVQHLEGGIVSEISVREGDSVTRDQPLVVLQSTASGADVNEMTIRLATLRAALARLEAETEDRAVIAFPDDIRHDHPDVAMAAEALFDSRRGRLASTIGGLRDAATQREQAAGEVEARLRNSRNTLSHLEEQVGISEGMLKEGLSNRYTHLALLRDRSALRSRIDEDEAALRRTQAAIKEARAQVETTRQAYRQEVAEQKAAAQREFDELSQRLGKLSDNLERTVIRSPVDGVVKTLHIATRGGVIKPGGTVVDIVPAGDRLIVEARLPTYDIGFVSEGQSARIKLTSQDAVRFGTIDGSVVHVGPDTSVTDKGAAFYKVRIETVSDHFQNGSQRYRLYPGMQVVAHIRTGERTVLAYIMEPFIGLAESALHER
ncbi:HlyD family type I secretion periplasmic adaptor subunit [Magnetospirillum sp. SS-4]|uniref:HlyD family type I secretion periplasmic adaptor subunit n=1 Tax=Magnetospirillum sp. SS-4 TaxID=2681465 RepID=UPI001382906C|nr:HlyD family type I secretion periplasmic adaptor subunit [Magnetospirillum sp. SS-4]CAA7613034.1 Type I secretion membrane fusion protein [Magnetospirillum sp. SS-4]